MEEFAGGFDRMGGNESNEAGNAIDEAAVQRIREDSQKAQKAAQASRQDRKKNEKFAKFLSYLLQNLQDDEILASVYHVFFKTKHPTKQTTYLRKNINVIVICGIFAPFYYEQIRKFQLEEFFGNIYNFSAPITLNTYLSYLKKLSQSYHDNIPINKGDFLNFLLQIIIYYKLNNLSLHNQEERTRIFELLERELFT